MEENNSGLSTTTLGLLGLGGLGVIYVLARGGWGNNWNNGPFVGGCAPDPYTVCLYVAPVPATFQHRLVKTNNL